MDIPSINRGNEVRYDSFTFFKKGGMGEIYKGKDVKTGDDIVLKLVLVESPDEEYLLKTEFDVSMKLKHKNIVSSLHSGKIEINENNYLYMIQNYYTNGNLRNVIEENIPIDKCFDMISDILSGMKEIHKSIVHRDLKPENILIDSDGSLLITDFGLAKYIDERTRTRSFKGAGTIPYMSPECWTGDTNTFAMDIYALGIIFYEIITGHLPYNASNENEWKECHLFTPFPSISNYRTGNISKVDQIIQKMTNKRVIQRYKSIDEIITAIEEAKDINKAETDEAERLASLGNIAIQKKKAEELKRLQETKEIEAWTKFLNFEITELFNRFKEKINSINTRLEDSKINITESNVSINSTNRTLKISFGTKSLTVGFLNYDSIEKNNIQLKERSLEFQRQRNGFIMHKPEDSYFVKNNIILIGLAETSFKIVDYEFGYNLILKKIEGSNYGEWSLIQFSENISPPKTSFGINMSRFFDSFEKLNHSMFHTMEVRKFVDADIIALIEKILIQ